MAVGIYRLGILLYLKVDAAEIVVGAHRFRIEGNSALKFADGIGIAFQTIVGVSEVDMGFGLVRLKLRCPFERLEGICIVPSAKGNQPQIGENAHVVRVGGIKTAKNRLRIVELTGIEERNRMLKALL